jgi:hypothetical protein
MLVCNVFGMFALHSLANAGVMQFDPGCPRFAYVRISKGGAGNGHRYGDYILGLVLAIELNATAALDISGLLHKGMHGESGWMLRSLNMDYGIQTPEQIIKRHNVKVIKINDWAEAFKYRHSCNVMIVTGSQSCKLNDKLKSCFYSKHGAYDLVKWFVRFQYASSPLSLPLLYKPHIYNVAWHLRVGDITLLKGSCSFFERVHEQIMIVTQGLPTHIYFFFKLNVAEDRPPPGYQFLSKFNNTSFINNIDEASTIHHFLNADMLVTSGSSFTAIVSAITTKPVILFSEPKEGYRGYSVFTTSEVDIIDQAGNIQTPLMLLRSKVLVKYGNNTCITLGVS